MKEKKLIYHSNYEQPFEDRRTNDMPRLTEDIRTWWPIYTSVAGLLIVIGIYIMTVRSTVTLANDTACEVKNIKQDMVQLKTEIPNIKCDVSATKNNVETLMKDVSYIKGFFEMKNEKEKKF